MKGPQVRARIAAAWVALALVAAAPTAAQQPQDQVVNRQLAYNAARSQHQAAFDAWRVVEKQWNDAIEDHAQARRAGDVARQEGALTRALDLARELDRLERRVTELGGTLEDARVALLAALDDRLERLGAQLALARTPADRARVAAIVRDTENQQAQAEAERDRPAVRIELVYHPSIQFDPRDTPETLGAKAQMLRSKAEQADTSIAQIDRQIQRIERQLRLSRNAQSLVTGVERFGDVQVPVGAPNRRGSPGDVRARPDSSGVARPEVTPEQRLQELRLLRLQVLEAKRQFLERAGTFEALVRRIG